MLDSIHSVHIIGAAVISLSYLAYRSIRAYRCSCYGELRVLRTKHKTSLRSLVDKITGADHMRRQILNRARDPKELVVALTKLKPVELEVTSEADNVASIAREMKTLKVKIKSCGQQCPCGK